MKTIQSTANEMALKIALEALDRLARLGNEPHFGNSDGNAIAQHAIRAIKAAQAEHKPHYPLPWTGQRVCSKDLLEAGLPSSRTCLRCGLGPCQPNLVTPTDLPQ